jgi:5-formyltetrahydrofolate cyclo-ligase
MAIPHGASERVSIDIRERKVALRADIRARLKAISSTERSDASTNACSLLLSQEIWQKSGSVLFYSAIGNELNLSPLCAEAISQGKIVALPRFAIDINSYTACRIASFETSLIPGRFGVFEPGQDSEVVPLNQLDLVLVPGVAFDMSGRRLGRGKGFYDRLLNDVRGAKCGVGFDQQIESNIPVEPHDISLDYILTPTRWLSFGQRAALK